MTEVELRFRVMPSRNGGAPLVSVYFHPPESLRDPEGLRICRPEAGLVYTPEKVNSILFVCDLQF